MHAKTDRKTLLRVLPCACCIAFYVLFVLIDGPVICVDSESYIDASTSRPPLYPVFLAFFRAIFGQGESPYGSPLYLFPAALAAGILNGYAAWRVGHAVYEAISRVMPERAGLLGITASGMQLAVALLNRFSAKRGSMYAESILSESLAMPLYLLFCIDLWYWMTRHKKADLLRVFLMMLLCLTCRTQMVIAPALFLFLSLLHDVLPKNRCLKRFFAAVAVSAAAFAGFILLDCLAHYGFHGVFMRYTFGNKTFYSTMMYTARPEDAERIDPVKNADERILFGKILENCEEMQILEYSRPAPKTWIEAAENFALSYDAIGFNATIQTTEAYLDERLKIYNGGASEEYTGQGIDFTDQLTQEADGTLTLIPARRAIVYDRVISVINSALMERTPPFSLAAYGAQILCGLMNAIARMSALLQPVVLALYAIYLFLLFRMWKKCRNAAIAAEIVFFGILINSAAVGILMFTQSRYMLYNMGAFYAMLAIMLCLILPARSAHRNPDSDTASLPS